VVAIRVIGCGNVDAGDDAAGLIAARALRRSLAGDGDLEVVEAGSELDLLDLLHGAEAAIVVDAVRGPSSVRAGTPIRLDIDRDGVPSTLSPALSSHGIGLAATLALAATLGRLPPTVFFGLQVGVVDPGSPLSAAVSKAMPGFVELVGSEVRRLLAGVEATR